MTLIKSESSKGLSLACAANEQNEVKRPCKGYISNDTHLKIRAYCWHWEISLSQFVATSVETKIQQLQQSDALTAKIIAEYREATLSPHFSRLG